MLKTFAASAALAAAFAATPSWSETVYYVDVAPPAAVVETVPAPREGYVWAPGYYTYRDNRYAWNGGRWVEARPGYRYIAPRWVQEGNRWRYTDEQWIHDEDHTYGRDQIRSERER